MSLLITSLVALLTTSPVIATDVFDYTALQEFRNEIRTLIIANDQGLTPDHPDVFFLDLIDPGDLVLLSSIIRLIFHDCTGGSVPGRCDGCIDLQDSSNAGLEDGAVDPLSYYCDEYNLRYDLSYADCWALAATFAVEYSQEIIESEWTAKNLSSETPLPTQTIFEGDIPYYIGRKDCSNTPDVEESFRGMEIYPDNRLGWASNSQYLKDRFSFTNKEIVALISGAHEIGRGHLKLSGYGGPWSEGENTIANDFNWVLINYLTRNQFPVSWQQGKLVDADFANPQFLVLITPRIAAERGLPVGLKLFLMLTVDMEMYYDLSYYLDQGNLDNITCHSQAVAECELDYPGTVVTFPGETQDDYPGQTLCPIIQCPVKCEGGQEQLDTYIANNFQGLDENTNCPAGFLYQFLVDEPEFGVTFVDAWVKMITAGYKTQNGKGNSQQDKLIRIQPPDTSSSETSTESSSQSSSQSSSESTSTDSSTQVTENN